MKKITLFVLMMLASIFGFSQKYKYTFKISGIKDTCVMGYYFASENNTIPFDTAICDKNGVVVFSGEKKINNGMYFFYNQSVYIDFLINNEYEFTLETDTLKPVANAKLTGSLENKHFFEFQRFMALHNGQIQELSTKMKSTTNEQDRKNIETQLKTHLDALDQYKLNLLKNNPNSLTGKFFQALTPVKYPTPPKDKNGNPDQIWLYNWNKTHYWDNFNPFDKTLLYTPIYENKFITYYQKSIVQNVDSLNKMIDFFLDRVIDDELFRYITVNFYNQYGGSKIMGQDAVFIHLLDKYYIDRATWITEELRTKLKDEVKRTQPNLLNTLSKELKLMNLPNDTSAIKALKKSFASIKSKAATLKQQNAAAPEELTKQVALMFNEWTQQGNSYESLHQIENLYTIVWFWEPSCSHCQKETPELLAMYNRLKNFKNLLEVYAVYVEPFTEDWEKYFDHIDEWCDFVLKHQMNRWINVWDPFHLSQFREFYNVSGTPAGYMINNEKKFIAKRLTVDQMESLILEKEMDKIYTSYTTKNDRLTNLKKWIDIFEYKKDLELLKERVKSNMIEELKQPIIDYIDAKLPKLK